MISTVKRVGNGETDEGRALTCDIQLNSEMSSGWILEIHSAAIDAFVSQRCPVDNQVTFAGYLTVKRETKVGSQSKRNYLGPSSTHWQWLAASIEPVLNDNKAQGDGYFIWFCLPFSISVMNSTEQQKTRNENGYRDSDVMATCYRSRQRASQAVFYVCSALEIYYLRVDRLLVGFQEPDNKVNGIVQWRQTHIAWQDSRTTFCHFQFTQGDCPEAESWKMENKKTKKKHR